ncbi:kynureninase [Lysinibacillus fusiformis]|uniref:kynureninase n=1 Tax=Lysinibacillus fusiformis TaxID=28031 RepID=UPI002EC5E141|nr:kynureninase [Lysinibacillus fusiformis]
MFNMEFNPTREYAAFLDKNDDLKGFREQFYLQPETIYFDGNSLGLLSKKAEASLLTILDSWKQYGIDGWTQGEYPWFYLSEQVGAQLAKIVGAKPEEVIATGSTTVNMHQMIATFYKPTGNKTKIVIDELNFPTDLYAVQSQLGLHYENIEEHIQYVRSKDGHFYAHDDIVSAMTDDVALIILPGVLYRSGQILDMEALTKEAHQRGILIGFDLCHSVGSIEHSLHDWDVDFAFWCNYKHLNGGPGAVAGLFVNEKHFNTKPGLAGWFSSAKEKQFDMETSLIQAPDAGAYQMGSPHLLNLAPLLGALELFNEAGIQRIRKKSIQLTEYFIAQYYQYLGEYGFEVNCPVINEQRGGHIFLTHTEAARICKALKAKGVIPDFRAPNGIRIAPVALYNTFEEVYEVVQILKTIMDEKLYEQFKNEREIVA